MQPNAVQPRLPDVTVLAARLLSLNADELPVWVIPNWLTAAATLERLARGEATIRKEVGGTRGQPVSMQVDIPSNVDRIGAVLDLLTDLGIAPPPPPAPDD